MKTKGKKGKGHCNKGGKTMKKGGRNVLVPLAFLTAVLASGKSKKPRKSRKSKKPRKSRKGGRASHEQEAKWAEHALPLQPVFDRAGTALP
jgi:hypothetical protein